MDTTMQTNRDNPSVSIVTISQYSRRKCLINLSKMINSQVYKNITEWIIVDGSRNLEDSMKYEKYIISQWKTLTLLPFNLEIIYIPLKPNQYLSDLRNTGNNACHGDIIVCMDDDDYYPPTRVSHAVYRLLNSSALIAGCSNVYMYLYLSDKLIQFKKFSNDHSTNNCLAYKKEYLIYCSYKPGLLCGEESSFTNDFSEPMVQLDPKKCIVVSAHSNNTVDKIWILEKNENNRKNENNKSIINELPNEFIDELIPSSTLSEMKEIFKEMNIQ
jgi:glycosyltransferase involved in cell wall biosynthesis